MNIYYCTTVLPSQQRTGGEIASQSFIDALRQAGHNVTVLGYRRPDDPSPLGLGELVVGVRPIESEGAGLRPLGWMLSALVSGRPYSCEKYSSAAYRQALQTSLAHEPHSLVILDHAQVAFLAADLPTDIPMIFVAHNVEAQLYRSQVVSQSSIARRWLFRREARLISRLEQGVSERASQTWVLTEQDASSFRASTRGVNVFRCDLPGLARAAAVLSEGEFCWDVGLIGTWTWGANALGLQWFLDHVVPNLPLGLRVAVAGKGADGIVSDPVVALGFVPDAMAFMRSCQVVCIPSVSGGGVQIKTIDAIASGRPIVATSIALRGISDSPENVVVADDPVQFSSWINALLVQRASCSKVAMDWARVRRERFDEQISDLIAHIGEEFYGK